MSVNNNKLTFIIIRFFDLTITLIVLVILSPILFFLTICCYIDSGSAFFLQQRLGKDEEVFILIKFRTMFIDTPSVPSHLASSNSITKIGKYLRKTKLDELPQLWNVLKGEMSLVGPRPNLTNQLELIAERRKHGIYYIMPGITGISQIRGIDMTSPSCLAISDSYFVKNYSLKLYIKIIFSTLNAAIFQDSVK